MAPVTLLVEAFETRNALWISWAFNAAMIDCQMCRSDAETNPIAEGASRLAFAEECKLKGV